MRWLEGWFATASGVLGIVLMAIFALAVPFSPQSQSSSSCTTVGTSTTCYGQMNDPTTVTSFQPDYAALILIGVALLVFVGVLVGAWLDLSGRRRVGRVILLTSATLLLIGTFALPIALGGPRSILAIFLLPLLLMGFVAGILACVRRDAPPAASLATAPEEPLG